MTKRKVLVIGAAGMIAGQVLPALRDRYDLTLLDVRTADRGCNPIEGVEVANLIDRERDAYRRHFQGIDAVVHFGFIRNDRSNSNAHFWDELNNVQMAYNIYQTSLEEGVKRVLVASSNHAADYYESLILDGKMDFVDPNGRALSDNFYGWAKEVYEHLGFVFATGHQTGKPLGNVHIRIGGPRETDIKNCRLGDLRCMRRALAVYISDRDIQQLFVKSIETDDIFNEQGVPFQIFYGISNNPHAFWSIANVRRIIGYEPQDNSEIRFIDLIVKHVKAVTEK